MVDVYVHHSKTLNFHRRFSGGKVFATIYARQKIIMVSEANETRSQTQRNKSDNSEFMTIELNVRLDKFFTWRFFTSPTTRFRNEGDF